MTVRKTASVLAMTTVLGLAPVNAQALSAGAPALERTTNQSAMLVRYRGHHHRWRHRHHHHHFGRDLAIGLGLGLLGSAIAAQPRGYYYYSDDARSRCAARFKSFESDTGLYTTYGGDKRLCPYLR